MVKVKIIKNTWGHSKKCWYIIDVENNISLNYTGHTSKKAALKVVEAIKGMATSFLSRWESRNGIKRSVTKRRARNEKPL